MIVDGRDPRSRVQHDYDLPRVAGRFVAWAGLLYLLAICVDLGILWIGQNQGTPDFEFVALTRSAEAFPRLILASALIYTGLGMLRSDSLLLFRVMAGWVVFLGAAALVLVALVVLNYTTLSTAITPEARSAFRASVVKSGGLTTLYAMFLLPLGVLGFRGRRSA